MRVLHAEAGEQHFRIAIGKVVAIFIGVEKQVGRLRDEDAAVAERHPGGEIQSRDEIFKPVHRPVAISVLADRDPVRALRPARRRPGHAVVFRAEVLIHAHGLETGGIGILQILHDPEAAAFIETHRDGLADVRLAGDEAHLEAGRDAHPPQRS